jgi:hypothetical protein
MTVRYPVSLAAFCNQVWTLHDQTGTDCHGVRTQSNRYLPIISTSRGPVSYKMTDELGEAVQELLRIRAEILTALEQVDEVIAAAKVRG